MADRQHGTRSAASSLLRRRRGSTATQRTSPVERLKAQWERAAVFGGLAYALGYVARALNAWEFNFGALPGARFDYLIAGVFLAFPVALLAGTLWLLYGVARRIRQWALDNASRTARTRDRYLPAVALASMLAVALDDLVADEAVRRWVFATAVAALVAATVTGALLAPETPTKRPGRASAAGTWPGVLFGAIARTVGAAVGALFTAYIGAVLILAFAAAALVGSQLLSKWPQELGGVKPKCAILDLAVDQLSPEVASMLAGPPADGAAASRIVRSHRLEVYSTSGPWLVRVPAAAASAPPRRSLRLPDQAVRAVEWVGRGTPQAGPDQGCPA